MVCFQLFQFNHLSHSIILSGKTVLTKKNLKDLLIYYKDNVLESLLVGFIVLIALTIGIILHELIHGITWAKYTKDGFKSIVLSTLKLTSCHCKSH
jgi:hypothetical protein